MGFCGAVVGFVIGMLCSLVVVVWRRCRLRLRLLECVLLPALLTLFMAGASLYAARWLPRSDRDDFVRWLVPASALSICAAGCAGAVIWRNGIRDVVLSRP
jgi:hypothetical protein